MFILGTHDTMTYATPTKWWMKPFKKYGECQTLSIKEQLNIGVTYFDLRIRFDKKGKPYFCHGLLEFSEDVNSVLSMLDSHCDKSPIYLRLMLEITKEDKKQEEMFDEYRLYIAKNYSNLNIWFCKKYNLYVPQKIFGYNLVEKYEWINSVKKFLLTPKFFARQYNKEILDLLPKYQEDTILVVDYITDDFNIILKENNAE